MNFIRGLVVETRDVVTETVYRLQFGERNDLAAVRRIALDDGNNYRSRSGNALPDIGAYRQQTPPIRSLRIHPSSSSTFYLTGHESPSETSAWRAGSITIYLSTEGKIKSVHAI